MLKPPALLNMPKLISEEDTNTKRILKRILNTNLCQVLFDVKYTGDWQLNLKKQLARLSIKTTNIHGTKNEVSR